MQALAVPGELHWTRDAPGSPPGEQAGSARRVPNVSFTFRRWNAGRDRLEAVTGGWTTACDGEAPGTQHRRADGTLAAAYTDRGRSDVGSVSQPRRLSDDDEPESSDAHPFPGQRGVCSVLLGAAPDSIYEPCWVVRRTSEGPRAGEARGRAATIAASNERRRRYGGSPCAAIRRTANGRCQPKH